MKSLSIPHPRGRFAYKDLLESVARRNMARFSRFVKVTVEEHGETLIRLAPVSVSEKSSGGSAGPESVPGMRRGTRAATRGGTKGERTASMVSHGLSGLREGRKETDGVQTQKVVLKMEAAQEINGGEQPGQWFAAGEVNSAAAALEPHGSIEPNTMASNNPNQGPLQQLVAMLSSRRRARLTKLMESQALGGPDRQALQKITGTIDSGSSGSAPISIQAAGKDRMAANRSRHAAPRVHGTQFHLRNAGCKQSRAGNTGKTIMPTPYEDNRHHVPQPPMGYRSPFTAVSNISALPTEAEELHPGQPFPGEIQAQGGDPQGGRSHLAPCEGEPHELRQALADILRDDALAHGIDLEER